MTDFRALCAELAVALDHNRQCLMDDCRLTHPLADKARAALAESVAEVLTDDRDKGWQWYAYCPEEGLEMYSDREQAQSAAQSIMGSYEAAAHSDGWHEDMESVSWGMLVPVEQAQVVEHKIADPDSEFDEWVKYELRPARAALAQPEPEVVGPTDEELDALWFEIDGRQGLGWKSFARAVLARFGHQPEPPAEGEVAAAVLRAAADHLEHHWDGAECVDHLQSLSAELEGHG